MYRTKTCGELRLTDAGQQVTLAGWVQKTRKMGGMTFVDLRDRYGITQLVFDESKDAALCEQANKLGREWCIQVTGTVSERQAKNPKMETGDIEILAAQLNVLSDAVEELGKSLGGVFGDMTEEDAKALIQNLTQGVDEGKLMEAYMTMKKEPKAEEAEAQDDGE